MKFTSIATILTLISVIQAQNATLSAANPAASSAVTENNTSNTTTTTTTTTTNTTITNTTSSPGQLSSGYPAHGDVPVPKPEWVELIKNANISNAPVLKSNGDDEPSRSDSSDDFCNWTETSCLGASVSSCPKGMWGLTFDDGPSEYSPILYDFLKATNQKATLFMIGANVIQNPDIVKRAYDEGHELAIHTWTHKYLTSFTNDQVIAELKWTELAIKEITGVSPRLFRPPYGDIDNRIRDIGTALGFTSVIWDHDSHDWMLAEKTVGFKAEWVDGNFTEWINEAATATSGGLSLEHDIQKVAVDAAIRNLPGLQKAYNVVTVGQCAGIPSYKESNSIESINSAAVNSSAVSSATSSASVTPAAPSALETRISSANNAAAASAAIHSSSSTRASSVTAAVLFVLTLSYML